MAEEARDEGGSSVRLDFPGFAQEFLRRNPAYRCDYERVMSDRDGDPTAQEVMARRWGLCFPGRSPSVGAWSACLLGPGRVSSGHNPRPCSGGF
ncbi:MULTISPECIES: transcriptional regulator domain-containing protein [unclassified Sphingopyxis]|nr:MULTISPECIES: DUF6499 domain-containing protein [unclassified Sphingopyxis]